MCGCRFACVTWMFVFNGSLTAVPSNPSNERLRWVFMRKLSHCGCLFIPCQALLLCGSACGLRLVWVYHFRGLQRAFYVFSPSFSNGNTSRVQKEPFNRKNVQRQRVVTRVGNNRCHRGGAARAYVFVVRVVKLLAEGYLDCVGNRVYLAARSLVFSVTF